MKTSSADTSPDAERVQLELMRHASATRRVRLACSLSATTIALSRRALRRTHPEMSDQDALLAWVAQQYDPELARRLRVAVASRNGPALSGGAMESSDVLAILAPVVDIFERLGIPYRIGRSLASSVYAVARATADVDIVAEIRPEQAVPLAQQLQSAYYVDGQMILDAIRHWSSFNLVHLGTMLKVDVFVPQPRPYETAAAQRARDETLSEAPNARLYRVASPEDVILAKLEWYRLGGEISDQQWRDIQGVMKVQTSALDLAYLRQWAVALDVADLLERALQQAGLARTP
ncbi:MAG: hypothetical protein ACHQ4H_01730 [Ktedonobacterales bacterium]